METAWKQDGNMLTDLIIALRIHCHLFLLDLSTGMSLYKHCLHLIKSLSCTPSFCSIVKFLCQENRRLVVLGHVNVSSGISFFGESQNMSCTGYLRRLRFKNIKFSYLNLQFGWQDGILFFGIANQDVKKTQRPQSSATSKSRCRTWPKWNNLTSLRHEDPIDSD